VLVCRVYVNAALAVATAFVAHFAFDTYTFLGALHT